MSQLPGVGVSSAGQFWLQGSSSEGSSRGGGPVDRWPPYTWLGSYCWLVAGSFCCHPCGSCHRTAWASSQHGSWLLPELVVQERTKQKPEYFYDLGTKIIHDHFCNIQLVTSTEMRGYRSLGASVILVPPLLLYSIKYFTIGSQRFYFFICVRVYVH